MQFFNADEILSAVAAPPVPNRDETARRIANDGLVQKVAMELAVQAYILDAVKQLAQSNHARELLLKRVGAVAITKPTFHAAEWTFGRGTVSGRPRIDGICHHCNQSLTVIAPEIRDGGTGEKGIVTLDDVTRVLSTRFTHCGQPEEIPEDIRIAALPIWKLWGQIK